MLSNPAAVPASVLIRSNTRRRLHRWRLKEGEGWERRVRGEIGSDGGGGPSGFRVDN
jgi:hypothetical protein